jgi:Tfp pilus assembly protein PilX
MIKNQRGAVQSTVILVISLLTLIILAGTVIYYVKGQIAQRDADKKLAQEMAEHGMTMALNKISELPTWSEGFSNVKYQEGKEGFYTVEIEKKDDSTFVAKSSGFISSMKTVITCRYRLETINDTLRPRTLNWEYN